MNNNNDIFVKINFILPTLPKAEKLIAKYLLDNYENIRNMNLLTLAQEIGSSDTSIIRFCKRLGYDGFSSFKQSFLEAVIDSSQNITQEISPEDSIIDILKKVINDNIKTLNDTLALSSDNYQKALDAIINAENVHFFGVGDAHIVAEFAFRKFSRIGYKCSAYTDVDLQLITSSLMTNRDVAVAISYSGASSNIVKSIKIAKECGATTICLTHMNKSSILKYVDIPIYISASDFTVGRDIVSRRVADQAIIEALYLGVVTKSNRNYDQFIKKTEKVININKI
ncbi:MurR/RpiR family transcriptional regulator [uncultured Brachyspira sp.]|uniref:MurR/RpiR family transcriptional regulator n=1 Tax=uncultured Brachyspira sp. TaxID=221953 RepID=UPI00262A7A53|nr:MurR/RpiR family transcriptional regulator [uncultured Brachyspira sp.]